MFIVKLFLALFIFFVYDFSWLFDFFHIFLQSTNSMLSKYKILFFNEYNSQLRLQQSDRDSRKFVNLLNLTSESDSSRYFPMRPMYYSTLNSI